MIRFLTATGSIYEVDTDAKQIRRLSGTRDPQPRQGTDGEWKPYEAISPIELGESVVITWPEGVPLLDGSPPNAKPATITSMVARVVALP